MKRVVLGVIVLVVLAGMSPFIFTVFERTLSVFDWFGEEHPTGNPMRVEHWLDGTTFDRTVDQLVFHMQNLEKGEQE
jgi:hypothetical protein